VIFTVAIDGPAAAGKGTIAREVARATGFAHLDTGLLYRAVGLRVLGGEEPVAAARALDPAGLADPRLRGADVAEAASRVAVLQEVRDELLLVQRIFARREGGAVLDGRDVGTIVCPEAEAKLFVTASPEARARRRAAEIGGSVEDTLAAILLRDARDASRDAAPMVPAPDAVLLDTSGMGIGEAVAAALALVRSRLG
jgi:cytidylate kinase